MPPTNDNDHPLTEEDRIRIIMNDRFGKEIMSHGYTKFPNAFFDHQRELGVNCTEHLYLQLLMMYDQEGAKPTVREIAKHAGHTERYASRVLSGLQAKDLIDILPQYTNSGKRLP